MMIIKIKLELYKFLNQTKKIIRSLLVLIGLLDFLRAVRRSLRTHFLYARRCLRTPVLPKGGPVLVNLGCGECSGPGYINVDIRPLPGIHHIHDIRTLPMFANQSVDLLYACHVLEHIPREELDAVLQEWRRVLKTGRVFRFSVPNFPTLLEVYRSAGNDIEAIVNQLMGQDPPYDNHYSIWNERYARALLAKHGFKNIRPWDPGTARYHSFRDKSSRAMPVNGRDVPISLNLEADA